MREILLAGSYLFFDETEAPVLDPGRGRTLTGYFWAIAQDPRSYGGKDPPMVIYIYASGRGGEHARKLLASFSGVAQQCDGYQVYKTLAAKRQDLRLAHCWAHCRRAFFKLVKDDGSTPLVSEPKLRPKPARQSSTLPGRGGEKPVAKRRYGAYRLLLHMYAAEQK